MNNKSFAIIAIGAGVVLLYAAYTNRLASMWSGIKGDCACATGSGSGSNPGSNPRGVTVFNNPGTGNAPVVSSPITSGGGPSVIGLPPGVPPNFGINIVRNRQMAGDGSFRPSRQYLSRGVYNVSSTGGVRVTDAGQA
jgi:hypothetical protein